MKVGDLVRVKNVSIGDMEHPWAVRLYHERTPVLVLKCSNVYTEILDVDGRRKCLRTARFEVINASR
jgi:hypothetical protein